jgi:hypothetical protein
VCFCSDRYRIDALKIVMRGPDKEDRTAEQRHPINYRKNTEVAQLSVGKPASVRLSS